jgi:2-oxoglutarate ferredoxin oxidoreductase subunit delta
MMRSTRKPILQAPQTKDYKIMVLDEICDSCELCIEFCPRDVLEVSEEFNSRMFHPVKVVQREQCTGCLQCERICPSVSIFVQEVLLEV